MTAFWLNDPTVLFNNAGITEIVPMSGMNRESRLNAISRMIILLAILGYLLTLSYKIIMLGVVSLAMIALLYVAQGRNSATTAPTSGKNDKDKTKEGFSTYANYNTGRRRTGRVAAASPPSGLTFQAPTPQDPLMNVLLTDIVDNPNRPAAEPAFNPKVERAINDSTQQFVVEDLGGNPNLEDRLFRDLGDNYEFSNSMRSYFATPNTRIPNDQHAFAEYCYGSMISCKEGNMMACARANPVLGSITGAQ